MKMLWLLSGLGVGAGVMSLLDPEKGGEHDSCQIPDGHRESTKTRCSVRFLYVDFGSSFGTVFQGVSSVLALAGVR